MLVRASSIALCLLVAPTLTACMGGGGSRGGGGGGGGGGGDGGTGSSGCSVRDLGSSVEDTCTGEQVCLCPEGAFCEGTGSCTDATNRRYRIGVVAAAYTERDAAGECWDLGCGAPDPFVEIYLDGTLVGTTPTLNDTFNPSWDPIPTADVTVIGGSSVGLTAYDEDVSVNDTAFSCSTSLTAAVLRSRDVSCSTSTGEIGAVIVPL